MAKSKLLLIAGPSGAGKTTLIRELLDLDHRFLYIRPYTTRALRDGETDKIAVTEEKLQRLWAAGEVLIINELYGVKYGTPRAPMEAGRSAGAFPVVDWPIDHIEKMADLFPGQLCVVYVRPPDHESLVKRLAGRNNYEGRLAQAEAEINQVESHYYDHLINLFVVSELRTIKESARRVYECYVHNTDGVKGTA